MRAGLSSRPVLAGGTGSTSLVSVSSVHRPVAEAGAMPASTQQRCASSSSRRRARESPRAHARPGSRSDRAAECMVATACSIRFCSSSASTTSLFQTFERSSTRELAQAVRDLADLLGSPPPALGPSRNTAGVALHGALHGGRGSRRSSTPPLACAAGPAASSAASPASPGERLVARRPGSDQLPPGVRRRPAEHHEVDQRVAAQPVGAVHRGAATPRPPPSGPGTTTSGSPPVRAHAPRRASWSGCRPCCSGRSARSGSAPW